MTKKGIFWLAGSAAVMVGLPWLAVTFVRGDAGMAACFLLFYAVNPVYSAVLGAFSGTDVRRLGGLPVCSAALFLLGVWIFFDIGEPAFLLYAAAYLALGLAAMLICLLIRRKAGGKKASGRCAG